LMSLDSGMLVQLTDIRAAAPATTGAAPAAGGGGRGGFGGGGRGGRGGATATETTPEQRGSDSQEYLKKEQKELLQVVRDRIEQREEQKKRALEAAARKPFTLQARQTA